MNENITWDVDITWDINDPCQPTALGRNGVMKCSGINIWTSKTSINIRPITSRKIVGRAYITIPKHKISELKKVFDLIG